MADDLEKAIYFFLDIVVMYSSPPIRSRKRGVRIPTATFACSLRPLINHPSGKLTMANMPAVLKDLGLVDAAAADRMSSAIIARCDRLLARNLAGMNSGDSIQVEASFAVRVERLPSRSSFYIGAMPLRESEKADYEDDRDSDDGGFDCDFTFRVFEGGDVSLRKVMRTKEAVTCSVCLIKAPIGSVLIQLPCSHRYHGECIASWLTRKKNCPLCRFELP